MNITLLRLCLYYSNALITLTAAVAYFILPETNSNSLETEATFLVVMSALIFSALAIWVFSIGALITVGQLIYGFVKYVSTEENKLFYLHHCYAAIIAILAYGCIFLSSLV